MKHIGPCRILRKFSTNAYELDIPTGIGISRIFNFAYIYPYVASDIGTFTEGGDLSEDLQWVREIPVTQPLEFEAILDTKVLKSTRKKDYLEYFGQVEEASLMQKHRGMPAM